MHWQQRWSRGHMARGQGQGQPFRGQTLSRSRTGMLEAKNQGHRRKCFRKTKKKGLQKIFSGDLQKKVFKKFFRAISEKKGLEKYFSGDLQKRKTKKVFASFSARFLAFSTKILTVQKIVLSSIRGQGNFRGLEA